MSTWKENLLLTALVLVCGAGTARGEPRMIDNTKSMVTVEVNNPALFSPLSHDPEIAAPLDGGTIDAAAHTVELRFHSAALEVRDRGVSEKDRSDIQNTMTGPEVLDTQRYPEIVFRSTNV